MTTLQTRLRALYVQHGTNHVQEAADRLDAQALYIRELEDADRIDAYANVLLDRDLQRVMKERDEYRLAADTQAAAHKVERDELLMQLDVQAGSIEAVQAANQRLDTLSKGQHVELYNARLERDMREQQFAAAGREHGLTLVLAGTGYSLLKLGTATAQGGEK